MPYDTVTAAKSGEAMAPLVLPAFGLWGLRQQIYKNSYTNLFNNSFKESPQHVCEKTIICQLAKQENPIGAVYSI